MNGIQREDAGKFILCTAAWQKAPLGLKDVEKQKKLSPYL